MKLSTSSQELLAQLQVVSRVASTRSAVQALSGVQIAADESGVQLRATDMEVGLRVPLEAAVERSGTVVLPDSSWAGRCWPPARCDVVKP